MSGLIKITDDYEKRYNIKFLLYRFLLLIIFKMPRKIIDF